MLEVIPTVVAKDLIELAREAGRIRTFAGAVHVDVDDGKFAPYVTWPYTEAGEFDAVDLSALGGLFIEVHLMVEEPRAVGEAFARAGAHRILGHVEGFADQGEAKDALEAWRKAGAHEVGLAALFGTPLPVLEPLVPACDVVHLMSIDSIGVQGIPYNSGAPERIAEFHRTHPMVPISVDGGVSEKNIEVLVRAGATHFGIGSAIAKARDRSTAYKALQALAERASNTTTN